MNNISMILLAIAAITSLPASAESEYIIDNFNNIQRHASECFSSGRTWYSFGGLAIKCENGSITASGNLQTWAGFGIDPGNGQNGAPISVGRNNAIKLTFGGSASGMKVELYSNGYGKDEIWVDLGNAENGSSTLALPDAVTKGGKIEKLQFVFSPGSTNFIIKEISLVKQ